MGSQLKKQHTFIPAAENQEMRREGRPCKSTSTARGSLVSRGEELVSLLVAKLIMCECNLNLAMASRLALTNGMIRPEAWNALL